jgi:DNA-binding NtrC family response regulator
MPRLIAIDDEPQVLRELQAALHGTALHLTTESDPAAALLRLRQEEFDVVLADCRMPGLGGVALLTEARKRHPRTVRLLMTGHADMRGAAASLNEAGIFRFVSKPWGAPELRQAIADALVQRARLLDAGRALRADAGADDLSIRRRLGSADLRKLATA